MVRRRRVVRNKTDVYHPGFAQNRAVGVGSHFWGGQKSQRIRQSQMNRLCPIGLA